MEELISTQEAAELLGVSRVTVFRWIKNGKLPAYKAGRGYVIAKSLILKQAITRNAKAIIGFDIGGTKIAAGRVENGKITKSLIIPTSSEHGSDLFLDALADAATELGHTPDTPIGIGIAGQIDKDNGIIRTSPNLPPDFDNLEIVKGLKERLGDANIIVDNDAQCFTLGEAVYGAGRGHTVVIGVIVGTGIGGGLVIGKKLHGGKNNTAGEWGHMTVDMNSTAPHPAGRRGHLEIFSAGSGIERMYKAITGKDLDAKSIGKAALAGDNDALHIYEQAAEALAVGIADTLYVLDPDIVVIGGGMINEPLLMDEMRERLNGKLRFEHLKETPIRLSQLGSDAAILGAAALHQQEP